MRQRVPAVVAALLTLSSCVKTVESARLPVPAPPAPARTAVAENIRRQVRNAVDAGEGDVRVAALRRELAANPEALAPRLAIARHYMQAGYPEIALEHCRLAAARFPDSGEVAVLLARTLVGLGMPQQGKAHLQAYVAGHADASWEALSWLAILEDRAGEYASAEAHHRAALKLHSGSDGLLNNLGYNLLLQGRNADAAVEFRKAVELAPNSTLARSNLGVALAGQPPEALKQWESMSDRATAHNNLAAILIERGDYEAARREIDVALGYRKDHPAALNNLRLVAELDGGDASLATGVIRSPFQRFVRTLGVVLFGEPEAPLSAKKNEEKP